MTDGGNIIGKFKDEMGETAGEVARDVKDEIGQAIEQGVQSVVGTILTPQQIQQKQLEDQKKITEARRKIRWFQDLATAQRQVRQQEQQRKLQRQQEEQQQTQQKKIEKTQMQQTSKRPGVMVPEEVLRSQAERKVGKGLGG